MDSLPNLTVMTEKYDFHCHSSISDGALLPSELMQRAQEQGVTVVALTDHDTTAGYADAKVMADKVKIRLVPGIELSTSWRGKSFHIVGLGVDPYNAALLEATHRLQAVRLQRAEKIADKLEKKNIFGAFAAVTKAAGNGMITRTHFAEFLVAENHVSMQQEAFDRFLAKDKPAYVATVWADLGEAISWITQAGGIAVLAHPLRYKLSSKWMKNLLTTFKLVGGQGIEVVTGRSNPEEIKLLANYAASYELAGSVGSDFHSPGNQWVELGRLASLPSHIKPVWELLG